MSYFKNVPKIGVRAFAPHPYFRSFYVKCDIVELE
jgi:hypothetical protein